MRALLRDLRSVVAARLGGVRDPAARVAAIIDGNFAADQFAPETVSAWLAFWAEAPHSPELARLCVWSTWSIATICRKDR